MQNEWELLCVAEDIEVGDTLRIEIAEKIQDMVYVGEDDMSVIVVDQKGGEHHYRTTTLEGFGNPGFLLGKSKNALRLPKAAHT